MALASSLEIDFSSKTRTPTLQAPGKTTATLPDPSRVAIVKRITHCTEQKAAKVIRKLDEHDQAQEKPLQIRYRKTRSSTRLPDILNPLKTALVNNGHSHDEAIRLIRTLFMMISETNGGNSLYMPKAGRMEKILESLES